MSLRSLSDKALLSQTVQLTRRERETTLEILKHLNEIERRRLHLHLGYSSLFSYCTDHLGYSRSGAGRRVQASRCIRKFPVAGRLLRRGRVNTTSLSMIAGLMTPENSDTLLARIDGKSQQEVEAVAAELRPLSRVRDRVKPVCVRVPDGTNGSSRPEGEALQAAATDADSPAAAVVRAGSEAGDEQGGTGPGAETGRAHSHNGTSSNGANTKIIKKMLVQFAANTDFMDKVEKVRWLLSTKTPAGVSFEQIFEACLDAFIEKHDPEARAERRAKRAEKQAQKDKTSPKATTKSDTATTKHTPRQRSAITAKEQTPPQPNGPTQEPSRYIPPAIRDAVYKRDGGRCTFVGATGKRCGSRHNLHVDHIVPFANGGTNALSNLRLLCANHNWIEAERVLGPVMQQYTHRE